MSLPTVGTAVTAKEIILLAIVGPDPVASGNLRVGDSITDRNFEALASTSAAPMSQQNSDQPAQATELFCGSGL